MDLVQVIVFTGGPAAGKSTAIKAIQDEFGDKVEIVPEAATMLLGSGFPVPNRDVPYSSRWQDAFQPAVLNTQFGLEEMYIEKAGKKGAKLVICDRGVLDGAAYVDGGLPAFLSSYNLDLESLYARYAQVVHFESTATCNPAVYGKTGNENRYEGLAEAAALEYRTREAWNGHPNWVFVSGKSGITSVIHQAITLVSAYVDVEIERKFVLESVPEVALGEGVDIYQRYLLRGEHEMRLRRIGDQTLIAVKGSGSLRRDEWERPFPANLFRELDDQLEGEGYVEKSRYFISDGGYTLELDLYSGVLAGLITLECEFRSVEEADSYELPQWAIDVGARDVTGDPAYRNQNLARYGLPPVSG